MTIRLSRKQLEDFQREGLCIVPNALHGSALLESLGNEVERLGRSFSPNFKSDDAESISTLSEQSRQNFYRALRYLPSLAALGASTELLSVSRALGLEFPALMRSFNIRMDMPHQDEFLFHWHQDITYLLGSKNSLTFWLPLGRADRAHGTIEVLPGSHPAVEPFEATSAEARDKTAQLSPKDVRLVNEPTQAGLVIEVDRGDIVVFSQFVLHRSLPNRSGKPRWTIQIRYSDLEESFFRDSGFPFGDMTTIFKTNYLGSWTDKTIVAKEKR